jgi:TolA-binding protein
MFLRYIIFILFILSSSFLYADKKDAQRYFNSGKSSFHDGAYSMAVNFFEKAVSSDPSGELADEASYSIGLSYYQNAEYDFAVQSFIRFMNNYPDSLYKERAFFYIGNAYFKMKNYEKAVQQQRMFIKNYPESRLLSDAQYITALSLLSAGKFDNAADEFLILVRKYTNSAYTEEGFFRLGQAYFYDKDYKKALEAFQKYSSSRYRNEASFFIGKTYYFLDENEKALPYLEALSSQTNFNYRLEALYYSGMAWIKLEKPEKAVFYLRELSKIEFFQGAANDYREESLYKLGLMEKLSGDLDGAIKDFQALLSFYKNSEYSRKAFLELASCFVLKGDTEGALIVYKELSESGGENAALSLLKSGELRFLKKDFTTALTNFEETLTKYPDTEYGKDALYWKARCYLELGKYSEAIHYFEDFMKASPLSEKNEEIQMFVGNAYTGLNEFDSALSAYQGVFKKGGKFSPEALSSIAWVYAKKGESKRAIEQYKKLMDTFPQSPLVPLAYYSSGIIRYNLKDYPKAVDCFKKVVKSYPESSYSGDAGLKIAWIYYKEEKFSELSDYITGWDMKNLNSAQKAEALNLMGWAKYRLSLYQEAIHNFQDSIAYSTDKTKILEGMLYVAKSYYNLQDYTNAIDFYQSFIDRAVSFGIKTEIPAALSDMAWCWSKIGDAQNAEGAYQKLLKNYPESLYTAEAFFKLAESYYNASDYKKAIENYNQILALPKPGDFGASALYWMGWSYLNLNDKIAAADAFERLVKNYPKGDYSLDSLFRLGSIYYDLNNLTLAKKYYRQLVSSYPKSPEAEKAKVQLSDIELKEKSGGDEEKLYQILIRESKTPEAKIASKYKLAKAYQRKQKIEDALKLFSEIIDTSKGEEAAFSLYELAENNRENGNYVEAIRQYGNIFSIYKRSELYPQSLYGIAACNIQLGNNDSAKKYIQRLTEKYPASDWAKKAGDLLRE